jgi:hypothetical protein
LNKLFSEEPFVVVSAGAGHRSGTDMHRASPWHSHSSTRSPLDDALLSTASNDNNKLPPWPSPRRRDSHGVVLRLYGRLSFIFRFVAPLLPDPSPS